MESRAESSDEIPDLYTVIASALQYFYAGIKENPPFHWITLYFSLSLSGFYINKNMT
jgi:hypothetical protein